MELALDRALGRLADVERTVERYVPVVDKLELARQITAAVDAERKRKRDERWKPWHRVVGACVGISTLLGIWAGILSTLGVHL